MRAGLPAAADGEPFLPGPTFAAPYHLSGEASPEGYGRYSNPTWLRWEAALGELEGAPALGFASGMAACSAVLLALLRPGDALVVPTDTYGVVPRVAREDVGRMGVEVREVRSSEAEIRDALAGAALVWVETPTNPQLTVLDLPALAADVHGAGAVLCVDETLATPLIQPALAMGADVVVVSDSKAMTGHSDLVLGHVAARAPEHLAALRSWRDRTGAIAGPFEAWLAHRSLATLSVRLDRMCANALAVARTLDADRRVTGVRYPGLPSHPGHEAAARQMGSRFGPVLAFELPDAAAADRFLAATELIADATSFGGAHSTAERRARWGTDAVAEGFIRLSAGLEEPEDLVADVLGALDAAST